MRKTKKNASTCGLDLESSEPGGGPVHAAIRGRQGSIGWEEHKTRPDVTPYQPEEEFASGDTELQASHSRRQAFPRRAPESSSPRDASQQVCPSLWPTIALTAPLPWTAEKRRVVERMLRERVRRATWRIDKANGRTELDLELGQGALEGVLVRIIVSPEGKRIQLEGPEHVDLEVLRARLDRRLASRGYTVSLQ